MAEDKVNIVWHAHAVSRQDREQLNGHRGCVLWFTGLSGCGKSTVANVLDHKLHQRGVRTVLLDGDNVRHGLNAPAHLLAETYGESFAQRFGLGFDPVDRQENIRRISAVAQLFCAAGIVTLTAFVSPYRRDRDAARHLVETSGQPGDFIEVFVDTPLEICEERDPKGLYKKARAGEIKNFTGIDDPYEPPQNPEITLDGGSSTPDALAESVIVFLQQRSILSPPEAC